MDIKSKTKDNPNARVDLAMICKRPELELLEINGKLVKPKATYTLNKSQIKDVCLWVKNLKFPDGYVSNIARCVNVNEGKLHGMKSHDCHVFMERLMPLAFRDLLPKPIWDSITELSTFFKDICATEIRVDDMEHLEENIIVTVCKLEKIFPPGFFDSMEHLLIHLAYEAKVGGPVQYRWMYPFERCMHTLKKKARNKARVEGSIVESYIMEEISNFCHHYFSPSVQTRFNRVGRNDDGGWSGSGEKLSIFAYPAREFGSETNRVLTDSELKQVEIYILLNCHEIGPYLE